MAKKTDFFEGLRDAMGEGLEALRKGEVLTTRQVRLPPPPKPMTGRQIAKLRQEQLHLSQAAFARLVNTATQTVQGWEQGRTKPSGCALRFLRLIESKPEILEGMVELA